MGPNPGLNNMLKQASNGYFKLQDGHFWTPSDFFMLSEKAIFYHNQFIFRLLH